MGNLVSIVTVVYNNASTIRDAIESVLSQNYPNIQYIVIDGGSTDGTLDILHSYKDRIDILISEKDRGIYSAMNKGLARCEGEWTAMLNSDDVYADERVISEVNAYFDKTGADAVYGDLEYVAADNLNKIVRTWRSGNYDREKFKFGWMPPHPSFYLRTKFYKRFGKFNEEMKISADYELMLRMLFKHKLTAVWLPRVLIKMRVGGISNGNLKRRLLANREDKEAWRINHITPFFFTLYLKPLRKIGQFFSFL